MVPPSRRIVSPGCTSARGRLAICRLASTWYPIRWSNAYGRVFAALLRSPSQITPPCVRWTRPSSTRIDVAADGGLRDPQLGGEGVQVAHAASGEQFAKSRLSFGDEHLRVVSAGTSSEVLLDALTRIRDLLGGSHRLEIDRCFSGFGNDSGLHRRLRFRGSAATTVPA